MAALFSNGTTMSESEITSENRKKREEEMNLLSKRYNINKTHDEYDRIIRPNIAPPMSPPPPPPAKKTTKHSLSPEVEYTSNSNSNKRSGNLNGL